MGGLAFTVWVVDTGVDTQAQPGVDTFSSHAVAMSREGRDQAFCSFLGKHAGPRMKLRTQQGCGRGSGPAPTQVGACSVRTCFSITGEPLSFLGSVLPSGTAAAQNQDGGPAQAALWSFRPQTTWLVFSFAARLGS